MKSERKKSWSISSTVYRRSWKTF